jgi:hypothetical protein
MEGTVAWSIFTGILQAGAFIALVVILAGLGIVVYGRVTGTNAKEIKERRDGTDEPVFRSSASQASWKRKSA